MAKARNPITLSREFNIPPATLDRLGVLDVKLGIDTKLFIDPLLLRRSRHPEIHKHGQHQYHVHFETIIKLLANSRNEGDPAWKAAGKKLVFPEIKGTCLGYGAGSIRGSGFGLKLTERVLRVASQIVDIGIRDPDLFTAMALFEEDIGPDRISDMTTNIIMGALSSFNARILGELNLKGTVFPSGRFLVNRYEENPTPIIMVPTDILRDLPIANDWDSVADAARQNEELRENVNGLIAAIWSKKSKRDKGRLKDQALYNRESFETLLKTIKAVHGKPYDVETDPEGEIKWAIKGEEFANRHPLNLKGYSTQNLNDVFKIVKEILQQFRFLIEKRGLNRELYRTNGRPRHESTAQRLFFAVAYSYCRANNIDVSPEIDTGDGKIDFKFSRGIERVLVEIKLSPNPNVVSGYRTQLEVYKAAEETMKAIYLVLDVGSMGRKEETLTKVRDEVSSHGEPLSNLEFVDGTIKPAPSKR